MNDNWGYPHDYGNFQMFNHSGWTTWEAFGSFQGGFSDRDLPIKNGKISRVVVVYQRVTNDRSWHQGKPQKMGDSAKQILNLMMGNKAWTNNKNGV